MRWERNVSSSSNGTLLLGGSGTTAKSWSGGYNSGASGKGGDLGQAGSNGQQGSGGNRSQNAGGIGGAAGKAIISNGNSVNLVFGNDSTPVKGVIQ